MGWWENYLDGMRRGSQAVEGAKASNRPPGVAKVPRDTRPTMKKWGKYVWVDGSLHDHPEAEGG